LKPQSIMKGKTVAAYARKRVSWRMVGWGGAIVLLAIPFVAMRFSTGVNWSLGDFIVAGVMFGLIGGAFELAVRVSGSWAYRGGAALALAGTLLTVWANLAVGIVGREDNPANLWFFGALLAGLAGAWIARFRASGMSAAMLVTALSLWLAFAVASIGPRDGPFVSHGLELAGTSVFALMFLGAAALFRLAARP
jgi:hypothetical protein